MYFILTALLAFLGVVDVYFINHAYYSTLIKGASVQLVFGFEVSNQLNFYLVCSRKKLWGGSQAGTYPPQLKYVFPSPPFKLKYIGPPPPPALIQF